MSGFPCIERYQHTQLIIVHMDDSTSEIIFGNGDKDKPGHDGERWERTREGLTVHRVGGITTFPWSTIKSFTMVCPFPFPDEGDCTSD